MFGLQEESSARYRNLCEKTNTPLSRSAYYEIGTKIKFKNTSPPLKRRYFKINGAENKFTVLSPSSNRDDENRYFSRPRSYTAGVMIVFCSDDRKAADHRTRAPGPV